MSENKKNLSDSEENSVFEFNESAFFKDDFDLSHEIDIKTYKNAKAKITELKNRMNSTSAAVLTFLFGIICSVIVLVVFPFSLEDSGKISIIVFSLVWGLSYWGRMYFFECKLSRYQNIVAEYEANDTKKNIITNSDTYQDVDFKTYKHAKAKIVVLKNRINSKSIVGFTVVAGMIIGIVAFFILKSVVGESIENIILSIIIAVIGWGFFFFYFKLLMEIRISRYQSIIVEYETNNIQENMEEDIFTNLIKISYKYLDQYYLQVREQAQKSFIFTAIIASIGAILIFTGVILMFAEKVNVSYVSTSAGVITEFISSIFFYLYNKTITSMSNYHNKLVLSQNISLALRVADSLPREEQTKVKDEIVKELLKNIID